MTTPEQIDELVQAERHRDARRDALAAIEAGGDDAEAIWRFRLRHARLSLGHGDTAIDEAIFELDALLAAAARHAPELASAHAARIRAYAIKRTKALATQAISDARKDCGETDAAIVVAEGTLALSFDDRVRARELFERAIEVDPKDDAARLAMADLLYVLGDFDACHAELDATSGDRARFARVARLRAACFAATRSHDGEARIWKSVLDSLPQSDYLVQHRIAYALALAACARRDEALEQFRLAWREDEQGDTGRYARARVEYLERAGGAIREKRLPAFPTTAQKWNYCGPAVLELCLRYLDLELGQDEIAETVKRRSGTPMYEIVSYLRAHRVAARRVRATPERLQAAIDLGVPVIVQEEYSTTSHVAVITGYDESLGLFVASDPATHRPLLKSFEWTKRAGDLFGNGGVIVLGPEGDEASRRELAADAAGLVEERHLALLDECDRQRPRASAEGREDAALEDVVRLCDEALAIEPSFKLAWHRRIDALQRLSQIRGRPADRERMLDDLFRARTRFSTDEWPHQLHAHYLFAEGRYEEAYVEYLEASRRDPDDANNLQSMGECKWLAGDLAEAERSMLAAIALEPHLVRAAENLAAVYLRQLQELGASAPAPIERATLAPDVLTSRIDRTQEDVLKRASHFSRIACAASPDNAFNRELAGELALLRDDLEQAIVELEQARALAPDRPWSAWGLAYALERRGDVERARGLLEEATKVHWNEARSHLSLAQFSETHSGAETAVEALEHGIEIVQQGRELLARRLFELLAERGSAETAAARIRELAEKRSFDAPFLREVGLLLETHGQRGHAIALLRHAVQLAPNDVHAVFRLGSMLVEDLLTRDEGCALLERSMSLAPDSPSPRHKLAWVYLERDPTRALALLSPVLSHDDPYVLDAHAAVLERLGESEEAARALARALAAFGTDAAGLLALCDYHVDANRYDRALTLARKLYDVPMPDDRRDARDSRYVAAFRLAGMMREALPRVNAIVAEAGGVPAHLAFDLYFGARSIDEELAARAALVTADAQRDPARRLEWRIYAAGARAKLGDRSLLDEVTREAEGSATALGHLAQTLTTLHDYGAADEVAKRAYALDPDDREALTAMEEAWVRGGDLEAALGCARRLVEHHPHEHVGPERLALLHGKQGNIEDALACSLRAIDAAPFCHNAQASRAVALFMAGDLAGAERHARRSLAIEEPDRVDDGADALMITRAIEHDRDGLERCLATLEQSQPVAVFAQYKAELRRVASAA